VKNLSQILVFLVLSLILSLQVQAQPPAPNASEAYIDRYKDIAVSEMLRTGIPASIKLAQGLVESGAGKSTLSREANNHFGIKCNGGWEGPTYYRKDDDYKNGKLIKSCFRKFSSPTESYMAHSAFLTEQKRYGSLFSLARQDYYGWAKGLKKAGYATDPKYANKLIDIIEKYQLFHYDDLETDMIVVNQKPSTSENSTARKTKAPPPAEVIASVDPEKKSRRNSRSQKKTKSKAKSQRSDKEIKTHRVASGETIAAIARTYDLDETSLRLRNRIPRDAEPLPGEKIHLRKKISFLRRPKFTRVPAADVVASADEYLF